MTILQSLILPRYHVVYLLLFVLQVTGQPQPGAVGPYGRQLRPNQVPVVIVGMLIFTLLFSMIACCVCYKYRSMSSSGTNSDTDEEGRRGVPWTRRTSRGLEKDVIMSFPSFLYSQVKELKIGKGGVECAICLNEFDDGEALRLMPACSHAFHAPCIDVWLSSRSTCPVCRDNLAPKPGNTQNLIYPFIRPRTNQDMDLETANARRSVLESPDVHLLEGLTRSNNNRANMPPRSRSTGSSNLQITEMLFPRSHSTGHSLIPLGDNVDRFTLQLPEELRRQLSQKTLPQARSSRQGYRSGSVGSQRRGIPHGRGFNNRTISLSFYFSFQSASLHSEKGKGKEFGDGSFARLRPEMPQS
ncbi:RING-H2 finger protein ATL34 [Hirschfeldia incana]|nr:RING-H2 finger protein ATL34 [Hirschfeldia incana]